ncbi:hypothetical protein BC833DRAFT_579565 [Globomyces pollinis-pini]|nr:hypothetical protein BC833DRAFT_579565 [Globomyces pollinis-pini]
MACHIIPHSFASGEVGIWAQYYNPFCFDQNEGEYDVRNGILLSPSWYNLFRKYHFTIVYENEIYKIKTGILSVDVENGKVLTFPTGKDSNGNEWKDQWPAPEFFKWHNDKFDQRQIKLKANIDRLWFKIQRADGATHFDENDYRIKWLNDLPSTTDYEDPEISIKAPEDSLEFMEQLQSL